MPANSRGRAARTSSATNNCFTALGDPALAQRLLDQQLTLGWKRVLDAIARALNPRHRRIFTTWPQTYYWSAYQSEGATDLLCRDPRALAAIYPALVRQPAACLAPAAQGHRRPPSPRAGLPAFLLNRLRDGYADAVGHQVGDQPPDDGIVSERGDDSSVLIPDARRAVQKRVCPYEVQDRAEVPTQPHADGRDQVRERLCEGDHDATVAELLQPA